MDEQWIKCRCCGADEAVASLKTHIWRTHKNKKSKDYRGCVCGLKRCRLKRTPIPTRPPSESVMEGKLVSLFFSA